MIVEPSKSILQIATVNQVVAWNSIPPIIKDACPKINDEKHRKVRTVFRFSDDSKGFTTPSCFG
jgi:hypothetical protein